MLMRTIKVHHPILYSAAPLADANTMSGVEIHSGGTNAPKQALLAQDLLVPHRSLVLTTICPA